jgi:hypothetical protein
MDVIAIIGCVLSVVNTFMILLKFEVDRRHRDKENRRRIAKMLGKAMDAHDRRRAQREKEWEEKGGGPMPPEF